VNYASSFAQVASFAAIEDEAPIALDDMDADELLIQTMTDRQRLSELGKLVGVARYALEGHDEHQLQETKQRMQRVAQTLAEKYRSSELTEAAFDPRERGARLAELYLERAYKLLDEEYADIPGIERAIRELQ
jgi:ribonucleotide reductase alpha subunit